jgi:hypothetical protein
MDRKLCLNKESVKLYKITQEAAEDLPLVIYHHIENNALFFAMPKDRFEEEFVKLRR